jgi:hypothetical protein
MRASLETGLATSRLRISSNFLKVGFLFFATHPPSYGANRNGFSVGEGFSLVTAFLLIGEAVAH